MDLTPQFNRAAVQAMVQKQVQKLDVFVLNELRYVGLEFVRNARLKASDLEFSKDAKDLLVNAKLAGSNGLNLESSASFRDDTGALRSSIGYVIFKDGVAVDENFEDSGTGESTAEGLKKGRQYARDNYVSSLGYTLIVVAGMTYAAAVESKGFDVITGSSFQAIEGLKISVQRIKEKFSGL